MGQPITDPTQQSTTPPAGEPPTPSTMPSPTPGDGQGKGGKEAVLADLAKERDARQALERQLADQAKALKALEPLTKLAESLGVKPEPGKTEVQALTEQVTSMQQQMREAELRALRLEVAAEKRLTPQQAARLTGSTREELAKDADELLALFPAAAVGTPGTPRPDPSQGARGGANDLAAAIAEAQSRGDWQRVIALKRQQLAQ